MTGSAALIAGIDEVGRGCLAGPVYAAAVVLPDDHGLVGLRDSKKLSAVARSRLAQQICSEFDYAIGIAEVEEIDTINILQATLLAMQRAVAGLRQAPTLCRVDGNRPPRLSCAVETVVGGDALVPSIMAASIVAKVARDAAMIEWHARYPNYGLDRHKGYGTPAHLAALAAHGPSEIHRLSFAPCASAAITRAGSAKIP